MRVDYIGQYARAQAEFDALIDGGWRIVLRIKRYWVGDSPLRRVRPALMEEILNDCRKTYRKLRTKTEPTDAE